MTTEVAQNWEPAAEISALVERSRIVAKLRTFLADRGVLEVDVPILGIYSVSDPYIDSFEVLNERVEGFLQTSPESFMKRLLAAGSGDIFFLGKAFRAGEIGVNHNGDIKLAKELIDAAKYAGADIVKFQTFKADTLALKKTPKVPYQKRSGSIKESHHLMLKKLELSKKDHFILKKFCEKEKIEFISTPYDINSARFLDNLGVKTFKVASADIVDHQLHEFLAKKKKKVIISTGMASMKEIKEVLQIYKSNKNNKFSLLHCVSNYPCSDKSLNLKNIITLNKIFKCKNGSIKVFIPDWLEISS